jgi:hypothetical protein
MRSYFEKLGPSEMKIKIISAVYTQYSTIPLLHKQQYIAFRLQTPETKCYTARS